MCGFLVSCSTLCLVYVICVTLFRVNSPSLSLSLLVSHFILEWHFCMSMNAHTHIHWEIELREWERKRETAKLVEFWLLVVEKRDSKNRNKRERERERERRKTELVHLSSSSSEMFIINELNMRQLLSLSLFHSHILMRRMTNLRVFGVSDWQGKFCDSQSSLTPLSLSLSLSEFVWISILT